MHSVCGQQGPAGAIRLFLMNKIKALYLMGLFFMSHMTVRHSLLYYGLLAIIISKNEWRIMDDLLNLPNFPAIWYAP